MEVLFGILRVVRRLRTASKISQTRRLTRVILDIEDATGDLAGMVRSLHTSIQAAARTFDLSYGIAINPSELAGVRVDIVA